jgi:hypothetical protein
MVLLQVGDTVTTLYGINMGLTEQNPIVNYVLGWGAGAFIALKVVTTMLGILTVFCSKYLAWAIIAIYTIVVLSNINQLHSALS